MFLLEFDKIGILEPAPGVEEELMARVIRLDTIDDIDECITQDIYQNPTHFESW